MPCPWENAHPLAQAVYFLLKHSLLKGQIVGDENSVVQSGCDVGGYCLEIGGRLQHLWSDPMVMK